MSPFAVAQTDFSLLSLQHQVASFDWMTPVEFAAVVLTAILTAVLVWPVLEHWWIVRALNRKFGADFYPADIVLNATRYYVRPHCSDVDLSQRIEDRDSRRPREDLFSTVDRFCSNFSNERYMLLLADSGMGKSSFALNYYACNQRKYPWRRSRLFVVPLGHPQAAAAIRSIADKHRTILFIDAFDEDPRAARDYRSRLDGLIKECSLFRRVLITCRTQFIPRDDEIPSQTGVVKVGPLKHGEHGVYEFRKIYLAPFTDGQVGEFLRRRYPFWKKPLREKAQEVVNKIPLLSIRPLLLAYIPDVLEHASQIKLSCDLYELMVEKWYEREVGWWKSKDDIKRFSEEIAVKLYLDFVQRGTDRVTRQEVADLTRSLQISIDEWKTTARSLLNRDAQGQVKFAHRSIMEYLFIKRFLVGDSRCRNIQWTDQMRRFAVEIICSGADHSASSARVLVGADLREINFSDVNLGEVSLRGVNLRKADLSRKILRDLRDANLEGANLRGADLKGADLSGANLQGANLRMADLSRAVMIGTKLERVQLGWATLRYLNLEGANLEGAELQGANLEGTRITNCNLKHAELRGINLSGFDLSKVNLEGATLQQAILINANLALTNLKRANLDEATLHGADLHGAELQNASLFKADLKGANLAGAHLDRTNLERSNLSNASLKEAVLFETNLQHAELYGADFQGANLDNANLKEAHLGYTKFNGASFQGADLRNVILSHRDFSDTSLRGANLQECALESAHFKRADLTGANLRDARLNQADFEQANLSNSDLRGARMQFTKFEFANLEKANLQGTDLSGASIIWEQIASANIDQNTIVAPKFMHLKQQHLESETEADST